MKSKAKMRFHQNENQCHSVCVCLCVFACVCVLYADKSTGRCGHAHRPLTPYSLLCKGQAIDHNKDALPNARHKSRQHATRIGQKNYMRQTCCDVPVPACVSGFKPDKRERERERTSEKARLKPQSISKVSTESST